MEMVDCLADQKNVWVKRQLVRGKGEEKFQLPLEILGQRLRDMCKCLRSRPLAHDDA